MNTVLRKSFLLQHVGCPASLFQPGEEQFRHFCFLCLIADIVVVQTEVREVNFQTTEGCDLWPAAACKSPQIKKI